MADQPSPREVGHGGLRLSPAAFEQALREATATVQGRASGPGAAALIPELRRAIGARVTREEFDQGLRRLLQDGTIILAPHAHPEFLSPQEVEDALPRGEVVLYLVRWLK